MLAIVKNILFVAAGGAAGSVCRYLLSLLPGWLGLSGEWITMGTNILGSFLIGVALSSFEGSLALFCIAGFCGGFTTFSTFSAQTLTLIQQGSWTTAAIYVFGSVLLSLFAVWLGAIAGRQISVF